MEELADAIEDAQYVNAIATQDDGPRPVLAWDKPNEEQLLEWEQSTIQRQLQQNKHQQVLPSPSPVLSPNETITRTNTTCNAFSLEWTCQQPIGFFLFSQFVKEVHGDYPRINFVEDVARFRKRQGLSALADLAISIAKDFLGFRTKRVPVVEEEHKDDLNTEHGHNGEAMKSDDTADMDDNDGATDGITRTKVTALKWQEPHQTEIDEYDLCRSGCRGIDAAKATTAMDYPVCAECIVGLHGPVRTELMTRIETIASTYNPRQSLSRSAPSSRRRLVPEERETYRDYKSQRQLMHGSSYANHSVRASSYERSSSSRRYNNHNNSHTMDKHDRVAAALQALTAGDNASMRDISDPLRRGASSQSNHNSSNTLGSVPNVVEEDEGSDEEESEAKPAATLPSTTPIQKDTLRPDIPIDLFDAAEAIVFESLRRDYWNYFLESEHWTKLKDFLWFQDRRVLPDDFFVMRVLGRGGFGLVTACKKGTSGKLYAMKVMNKKRIKMKKSELLAINERQALAAVESKFVINLKYSFHSKEDVFLILDLMTGGDLGYHLHQRGRFSRKECLYYAARIALGLQALHDKQYVYRDLKPENCLLAEDGRVKITDLGLATKITPTLHGAAGTRGYWAPEMLRRDTRGKRLNYDHSVDWFSFGCCLAEFISGSNPFRSEAALKFGTRRGKQTKEKMIDCATLEMEPEFRLDRGFDAESTDLCRRLLDKNPAIRLGSNGAEDIMAHPWFKPVNWESVISDRKRPPFIPAKDVNAASQSEIGTFTEDKTYQETVLTPSDEKFYTDWDWTNPRAFAAEVIEFLIYERVTGEPLVPITQNASCCCIIL